VESQGEIPLNLDPADDLPERRPDPARAG
jgi:hypothetical protein